MSRDATTRAIVCVDHSPRIGGATRVLLTALEALDRAEFRAVVVCNAGQVADEYASRGHEVATLDLPILTFSGGARTVARTSMRFLRASGAVARISRERSAAAVYAHGLASALYAWRAAVLGGTPLVWHVHEMPEARGRMRPFVRLASSASRVIVCVSRAGAERITSLGGARAKVNVVYNAIPSPLAPRGTQGEPRSVPDAEPLLVAVGALTPAKGHATLVEAMAEIVASRPRATAVILGEPLLDTDPAYVELLRRRIDQLGLSDRVLLPGFRRDLPSFLARAAVVVHPSICEETFGLVPLEAMAQGRPVVASRVGGVPEVIDDGRTGVLVTPGDSRELSRAVLALLDDPAARERLGRDARRAVAERFSVRALAAGLNAAFAKAIGSAPFLVREEDAQAR